MGEATTHNRLDKPNIRLASKRYRKAEAYWDGELGGGSTSEELGEKSETDLTFSSLAYWKSLRTLSPVKTPA